MSHLDGMNRHQRRATLKANEDLVASLPDDLTELPRDEWGAAIRLARAPPLRIWRSNQYLVQLFEESGGKQRLSICRVRLGKDGRWEANLSWDELQYIKHLVGFGDVCAVEVYPRDEDVVNVANMRHLWLLPDGQMGWVKKAVELVLPP